MDVEKQMQQLGRALGLKALSTARAWWDASGEQRVPWVQLTDVGGYDPISDNLEMQLIGPWIIKAALLPEPVSRLLTAALPPCRRCAHRAAQKMPSKRGRSAVIPLICQLRPEQPAPGLMQHFGSLLGK